MQTTSPPTNFLDRYHIHSKKERSDETILIEKQTGEMVLMKEVEMSSGDEFRHVVETLEGQLGLQHEHLLSLKEYQTGWQHHPETGCQHKLLTFFQYASHSLLQQIDARYSQVRLFQERQLWNILMSCVLAMSYLQKEAVGHGCLSPIDIFLDVDGTTRIVDPSIASSSPLQIQQGYYYAPELLNYFKERGYRPTQQLDIFKADVFSLGVCMIHAAMLQSSDDCYDYLGLDVDYDELQNKINLISQHYSLDFVNVLIAMLKEDVRERPDFIVLEEQLNDIVEGGAGQCSRSNMTLSGQWSRISAVTYTTGRIMNNLSQTANYLAEDISQMRSQLVGVPHPQMIDIQVVDQTPEEKAKNDNFEQLLRQHTNTPMKFNEEQKTPFGNTYNNLQLFRRQRQQQYQPNQLILEQRVQESMNEQPPLPDQEYDIVERTIRVEYVPNSTTGNTFSIQQPSAVLDRAFQQSNQPHQPIVFSSFSNSSHGNFKPQPTGQTILNQSHVSSHSKSSQNQSQASFKFGSIDEEPRKTNGSTNNILTNIANLNFNRKSSIQQEHVGKYEPLVFDTKPILNPLEERRGPTNKEIIMSGNEIPITITSSGYPPANNNDSLLTDPAFLAMIKQDVNKILTKKEQANKQNNIPNFT